MKKFIETIRFEDGKFQLLSYHQARINQTFVSFFTKQPSLYLKDVLPAFSDSGKHKFRIEYDATSYFIERTTYRPKQITSMRAVAVNINYNFKFANRSALLNPLKESKTDEIIIIKNGLITDSSCSNLAFFDGAVWWTPKQPLLAGVRRAKLLAEGKIRTTTIQVTDLRKYEKISLINAMLDLGELIILREQIL